MNRFEAGLIKNKKQEEKEMIEIKNTDSFLEALKEGEIDNAVSWFEVEKNNSKHDERWIDHRSNELMGALCDAGRLDEAEKYIDYAQSEEGRKGRKKKIERLRKSN